ncbi:hypothetical protein HNQ65_001148 [Prosthecobacter vanneervenii]|uniref:Uncharacterized protein n=1 Tax=Prosthecobacter vanneervenii TaxID=48466 RepID=A0A7W8DJ22_9BACT|nr:hypothetical protein [Prosthecobacter vanneervenii]
MHKAELLEEWDRPDPTRPRIAQRLRVSNTSHC